MSATSTTTTLTVAAGSASVGDLFSVSGVTGSIAVTGSAAPVVTLGADNVTATLGALTVSGPLAVTTDWVIFGADGFAGHVRARRTGPARRLRGDPRARGHRIDATGVTLNFGAGVASLSGGVLALTVGADGVIGSMRAAAVVNVPGLLSLSDATVALG